MRPGTLAALLALAAAGCAGERPPTAPGAGDDGPAPTARAWGSAQMVADAGEVPLSSCGVRDPPCRRYYDERYFPALAMNERGEAVAAWHRNENGFRLSAARFDPASGWGREELVTDDVGSYAHRISLDADGTAAAAWVWYVPSHDRVTPRGRDGSAASSSRRGGPWAPDQPLGAAYDQVRTLQVGADGNGVALLARTCKFYDPACTWGDVLAARIRGGGDWLRYEAVRRKPETPCEEISSYDRAAAVAPRGGVAVAIWMEYDRGPNTYGCPQGVQRVMSSRYENGWSTPVLLDLTDGSLGHLEALSVAVDARGGALAVFVKTRRYDDRSVVAQRYVPGRGWLAPEVLGAGGWGPRLALDRDGNALVVWSVSDRTLHGRWFDSPSETWQAERTVSGSQHVVSTEFAIAVDDTGHGLAVWSQLEQNTEESRGTVLANRYTAAGGGWSEAVPLQAAAHGPADGWPSLAMDPAGNALAVWAESDGTSVRIWSNGFQRR